MDEATLPERLRAWAQRNDDAGGVPDISGVMRHAAWTIDQLTSAPEGRRFAASYLDPHAVGEEPLTFPTPAPGSFVLLGPVGSAWRVLAVDELAGHGSATHVLELEPVDPHDVPVRARVETVPMPVEELDADALYSVDAEGAGS